MASYSLSITLNISAQLSEDEMFPNGRPAGLPEGPLAAADVIQYLQAELSTYQDLEDWGFSPDGGTVFVRTTEGERGFGDLEVRP